MIRLVSIFLFLIFLNSPALADIYTASDALSRGDYEKAVAEFTKLAEAGDARAQANLGYMYYAGEGVPQDYRKAVYWYEKAAVQGNKDAQYNLAVSYAFGEGVKQDLKEAAIWYRRAGEQGHVVSQYSLGISYAYGEGVPQDTVEAARWFKKAAEQGYARAQVHMGSMHHTGEGVKQDYKEAVRWYRMAADRGDATAQYNLGTMYRSGKGVEQNYAQAKRWFRQSADQGYTAAQNELASLERSAAANIATRTIQAKPEIIPEEIKEPVQQVTEEPKSQLATTKAKPIEQKTVAPESEPEAKPEIATKTSESLEADKKPLFTVEKKDLLTVDESQLDIAETKPGPKPVLKQVETTSAPETKRINEIPVDVPGKKVVKEKVEIKKIETPYVARKEPEKIEPNEIETREIEETTEEYSVMNRALGIPESEPEAETDKEEGGLFSGIKKIFSGKKDAETDIALVEEDDAIEEVINEDIETTDAIPEDTLEIEIAEEVQVKEIETPYIAREKVESEVNKIEQPAEEYSVINRALGIPDPEQDENQSDEGIFSGIAKIFSREKESDSIVDETETLNAQDEGDEVLIAKVEEPVSVIKSEQIETIDLQESETNFSIGAGRRALTNNDYDEAAKHFRHLAESGNSDAQAHLGSMYYVGKGVEQDFNQAYEWYKQAADQGNKDAQYSIGNMYLLGEGVEQSNTDAANWYALASAQGHSAAKNNLENLQKLEALNRENKLKQEALAEQESEKTQVNLLDKKEVETPAEEVEIKDQVAETSDETKQEKTGLFGLIGGLFGSKEETASTATETYTESEGVTEVIEQTNMEEESASAVKSYAAGEAPADDTLQTLSYNEPVKIQSPVEEFETEPLVMPEDEPQQDTEIVLAKKSDVSTENKSSGFFDSLFANNNTTQEQKTTDFDISEEEQTFTESEEIVADEDFIEETNIENNDVDTKAELATEDTDNDKSGGISRFFKNIFSSDEKNSEIEVETDTAETEKIALAEDAIETTSIDETETLTENDTVIVEESPVSEFKNVRSLATQGEQSAQYELGTYYYSGNDEVEKDFVQAALWYRRSAQQGNADAQYSLGNMYLLGEGVTQDDKKAAELYAMAAKQGHGSAQSNLDSLRRTLAAKESETRTSTSLNENTSIGEEEKVDPTGKTQYERGLAYAFGDGVQQNDRTAFNFFYEAAEKGYTPAQYKVGVCFAYGEGVRQDTRKAAEWYQKAAEKGFTTAQRNLATLYLNGNGIKQDKIQALAWYQIVANSGNAMDIRRRDMLKKELTEIELSQSEELANQITDRLNNNASL